MDTVATMVAIITGLIATAVYAWYLWVHCGMRDQWKSFVKRYREEQDELAAIRRMWEKECA